MMGRREGGQGQFFYSFDLDKVVLSDHLVRQIDGVLDLGWVHKELAAYYSHTGRPSIDPVLMIRMLIVGWRGGCAPRLTNHALEPAQVLVIDRARHRAIDDGRLEHCVGSRRTKHHDSRHCRQHPDGGRAHCQRVGRDPVSRASRQPQRDGLRRNRGFDPPGYLPGIIWPAPAGWYWLTPATNGCLQRAAMCYYRTAGKSTPWPTRNVLGRAAGDLFDQTDVRVLSGRL
jgi:hypothetical protein